MPDDAARAIGGGHGGFRVFGDRSFFQSLYLTVVILTTVGMKESDQPLTDVEQGWSVVLMLVCVATVLYASGALVAFLIDGDMRRLLGRRKVNKADRSVELAHRDLWVRQDEPGIGQAAYRQG